jgi:HEAT repeat protein
VRKLESPDARVRQRAVEILQAMGDSRAFDPLVSALSDDDSGVRFFAALGLADLGDSRAVAPVVDAHRNEQDPWTRVWMAAQVARLGEASILPEMFADVRVVDEQGLEDWDNHWMMLDGFSKIGGEAAPALITAVNDSNSTVRWLAVMGLGEIRAVQAIEILEQVAQDPKEEKVIREWADLALEEIRGREESSAS